MGSLNNILNSSLWILDSDLFQVIKYFLSSLNNPLVLGREPIVPNG